MSDLIFEFLHILFSETNIDNVLRNILVSMKDIFKADRVTLFIYNQEENFLESVMVSGDDLVKIKVPVSTESIAGYTFITEKVLNIKDVYDDDELRRIDPSIKHDKTWDHIYSYRTKSILSAPLVKGFKKLGVVEVINKDPHFSEEDENLIHLLCKFVSLAVDNSLNIYSLQQKTEEEKIIIENISESVAISDANLRLIDVNTSFLEMVGYRYGYQEIINMPLEEVLIDIGPSFKEIAEKVKINLLPAEAKFEFIKVKIIPVSTLQFGESKLKKLVFIFNYPKG